MSTAAHPRGLRVRQRAIPSTATDPLTILTGLISVFAAAATTAGLVATHLYRDNSFAIANWRGNDLVTLVAIPVLVGAYAQSRRGSKRAHLVWLGLLWYMLYNYAFYLFGTAFNDIFLVYAAIVACSMWALILGLMATDVSAIARGFRDSTPVRWIAGYLALAAVGLAIAWIVQSLNFATGGKLPQIMIDSHWSTNYVFALDLTLVIPAMLVAAINLWRRRPWGYILGTMFGVQGAFYGTGLLVMSAYQADRGQHNAWGFAPVAVFLLVGCLLVATALLTHMSPHAADRTRS